MPVAAFDMNRCGSPQEGKSVSIAGWLKEGAKWGAGTLVGVLLTLVVTSYLERPRPSVEIAQISTTSADADAGLENPSFKRIVSVPLSDDLFTELAQSVWTESFRDPSDALPKIISRLNTNKGYVEAYLRHAQDYLRLRREMTLLLNGERSARAAENFFDDWQQVDGFIYGAVRSQMRYGSTALRQIKCDEDSPKSHLRKLMYLPDAQYFVKVINGIRTVLARPAASSDQSWGMGHNADDAIQPNGNAQSTEDQHIYSVAKLGGKYNSRFDPRANLDENDVVTPREEQCAENVMDALAEFDKDKLNAILDVTDQEAKGVELHKKIRSDLEKYIKGYSFWNVSVLISNKGKDPISFSPNATLHVDLSGTPINAGNNLVIDLKNMNKVGDSEAVTVLGGETRAISFISADLVKDHQDWNRVIDLFEQSSRKCFIVLYPQTGDWQRDKRMFSAVQTFGPPPKASPTEAQEVNARFSAHRRMF
jgi:hypothetical protein